MIEQLQQTEIDRPLLVRHRDTGGFLRGNRAFLQATGFTADELGSKPLLEWIYPDDRSQVKKMLRSGGSCQAGHITSEGRPLMLELQNEEGGIVLARAVFLGESPDFGGTEASVKGTLHIIAKILEDQYPGHKCSILLVADGKFVRGAGPSLSEEYNSAIDGFAIGPTVGSCGTAIYWNVPVIVEDIQNDPLWLPFRDLAKKEGVAACWSHPFTSRGGAVLGALAFYSPEPRTPTPSQLSALRAAARMTGLAVERGRAEEALREKRKRELELEDQLRQAAKMEALGVLAGGVAHDFNNVLTTILSNAEFALELSESNEEVSSMLRDVVQASQRAGSFCTQMLNYAGRGALRANKIEFGGLLPQLTSLVSAAVPKKAALEYNLIDRPVYVEGDENQLLQVIMNLITNAAESLGENGGWIEVGTELEFLDRESLTLLSGDDTYPPGEYVKLSVADTGCGMNQETISRIFDPFYTTKFTGRGLGLAAVKGIILKHRGTITLESKIGVGTTFTIYLPTVSAPEEEVVTVEEPAPPSTRPRLMIVDDEDGIRSILCKRLRRAGYETLEASDGEEAINMFRRQAEQIDCVLLDLSMPKLGGDEVCQEMKNLCPKVPIVVMSGFAAEEVAEKFQSVKVAGALQKPFGANDLLNTVNSALLDNGQAQSQWQAILGA